MALACTEPTGEGGAALAALLTGSHVSPEPFTVCMPRGLEN